jgi:hypothetical protein
MFKYKPWLNVQIHCPSLRQINVNHVEIKLIFVCGKKKIGHSNFLVKLADLKSLEFNSDAIGRITPITTFL